MNGLLAKRTEPTVPTRRLVFDVVCRITGRTGEKPTGWHMMACWRDLPRAEEDLMERRMNLIKGGVQGLDYDIHERAI